MRRETEKKETLNTKQTYTGDAQIHKKMHEKRETTIELPTTVRSRSFLYSLAR